MPVALTIFIKSLKQSNVVYSGLTKMPSLKYARTSPSLGKEATLSPFCELLKYYLYEKKLNIDAFEIFEKLIVYFH